jgi:hypothetical protein
MNKIFVCECGCFKFFIGWSTADCAHCGKRVEGHTPKNWTVKHPDVIDMTRFTGKHMDVKTPA